MSIDIRGTVQYAQNRKPSNESLKSNTSNVAAERLTIISENSQRTADKTVKVFGQLTSNIESPPPYTPKFEEAKAIIDEAAEKVRNRKPFNGSGSNSPVAPSSPVIYHSANNGDVYRILHKIQLGQEQIHNDFLGFVHDQDERLQKLYELVAALENKQNDQHNELLKQIIDVGKNVIRLEGKFDEHRQRMEAQFVDVHQHIDKVEESTKTIGTDLNAFRIQTKHDFIETNKNIADIADGKSSKKKQKIWVTYSVVSACIVAGETMTGLGASIILPTIFVISGIGVLMYLVMKLQEKWKKKELKKPSIFRRLRMPFRKKKPAAPDAEKKAVPNDPDQVASDQVVIPMKRSKSYDDDKFNNDQFADAETDTNKITGEGDSITAI